MMLHRVRRDARPQMKRKNTMRDNRRSMSASLALVVYFFGIPQLLNPEG